MILSLKVDITLSCITFNHLFLKQDCTRAKISFLCKEVNAKIQSVDKLLFTKEEIKNSKKHKNINITYSRVCLTRLMPSSTCRNIRLSIPAAAIRVVRLLYRVTRATLWRHYPLSPFVLPGSFTAWRALTYDVIIHILVVRLLHLVTRATLWRHYPLSPSVLPGSFTARRHHHLSLSLLSDSFIAWRATLWRHYPLL